MCMICGRSSCMPSFHSVEEQEAYEPAEAAYENYLDIREQCRKDWMEMGEDDNEDIT